MYVQDSELFMVCQIRKEDIDMSYVALLYILYILDINTSVKQLSPKVLYKIEKRLIYHLRILIDH